MNGSKIVRFYDDVQAESVKWLWYPYIASGKITLLQGDPGCGKSSIIMSLIASFTKGTCTPDGQLIKEKKTVIYQCSEDGIADTIKPRLESFGADCSRVAFIDEDIVTLTLNDERLREAIQYCRADLVVIDPFQAYLGESQDPSNMKKVRKLMKKLDEWAAENDCAIILVGHMTKANNSNDLYRGVGSIDFVAAARSVLQIVTLDEGRTRYMKHAKCNIAGLGDDLYFTFDENGFRWIGKKQTDDKIELHLSKSQKDEVLKNELRYILRKGPVSSIEVYSHFDRKGISKKRLNRIKNIVGVECFRKNYTWYWKLEGDKK